MFTNFKISAKSIISIIAIAFIIYIMGLLYPTIQEAGRTLESFDLYRGLFTLLTFIIGLLIELDRLLDAFSKGVTINPLGMLLSILILLVLFIPVAAGMSITGFGTDAIILQEGWIRGILGVCSGIIFARAI